MPERLVDPDVPAALTEAAEKVRLLHRDLVTRGDYDRDETIT